MPVFMSQVEYAEHRGVSQPYISRLVSRGKMGDCIQIIDGYKKIDRDKADAALEQSLDHVYNPKEKKNKAAPTTAEIKHQTKAAGTSGMSLADAQRLQAQYKAALMKLEYEEKSGTLVKQEQVDIDFFNCARRARDAILNIPGRVSAELAIVTDIHVVSQKLTTELTAALEELSQ